MLFLQSPKGFMQDCSCWQTWELSIGTMFCSVAENVCGSVGPARTTACVFSSSCSLIKQMRAHTVDVVSSWQVLKQNQVNFILHVHVHLFFHILDIRAHVHVSCNKGFACIFLTNATYSIGSISVSSIGCHTDEFPLSVLWASSIAIVCLT